jgi:hypothetical protein
MAGKVTPLRRRITPSVPLNLKISDSSGEFEVALRLQFDFNVIARIEQETGLNLLNDNVFKKQSATVLSVMLWATALPNNPEYDCEDGLETMRSYLDSENIGQVSNALSDAYLLYLPKAEADRIRDEAKKMAAGEPVNPPKVEQTEIAAKSDGSTSGQSQPTTSDSATSSSAS